MIEDARGARTHRGVRENQEGPGMTQEVPGYTGESRENQEGPDRTNEVPGRTGESERTRRVQTQQMRCQDAQGSQREPGRSREDK